MSAPAPASVWIVQHAAPEGPGVFGSWLADDGLPVTTYHVYQGDPLPASLARCRGLIVLGGPMHVDESKRIPWLLAEVAWLKQAMAAEIPMLGICLGAQLFAHALGARVYQNAQPEVGWHAVQATPAAATDPLFAAFPARYMVLQWHAQTYELPMGAVCLAHSPACAQQAFRMRDNLYALQYHLEITPAMLEAWLCDTEDGLRSMVHPEKVRADTTRYAPPLAILARQFYSGWRTLVR